MFLLSLSSITSMNILNEHIVSSSCFVVYSYNERFIYNLTNIPYVTNEIMKMICKNCGYKLTKDSIGYFHQKKAVNWDYKKECTNPQPKED